jgi:glycosyltransferase involved in cell wall biosynthesis
VTINILIRTGRRSELFTRCIRSVMSQTYKNIRVILSTDTNIKMPECFEFIKVVPNKNFPYFWNLYCNDLKDQVKEGWFFFLDDDDFLEHDKVIEEIAEHLTNESEAVICQFKRWDKKKPTDDQIKKGEIYRGMIGMPCIFLHASQKNVANFDGYQAADYRFIKEVTNRLKTKFVNQVVVKTDRIGAGK